MAFMSRLPSPISANWMHCSRWKISWDGSPSGKQMHHVLSSGQALDPFHRVMARSLNPVHVDLKAHQLRVRVLHQQFKSGLSVELLELEMMVVVIQL